MIRMKETIERGMTNITFLLTTKCTLKCDLCATYTPQQKNPQHFAYETLSQSFARLMHVVDRPVGILTLSGGEPLLHPDLSKLIHFIRQYEDRMEMVEIITNGTIVPSAALLESLKGFEKANILVDDYGPKCSVNVEKVCAVFEEYGIAYRRRKYNEDEAWFGGWIDVSDFSEKHRTQEETNQLFSKCAFMNVYCNSWFVINGVAHVCYVNKQLLPFVPDRAEESVNLLDESLSDKEILERLYNMRKLKSLLACKNCNGYLVESPHKKPAIQLL